MSVEKRLRRCVDPCQRFLTPDDTHDLCVMCLGEEHARSVLEGIECAHCELFSLGKLHSRMSLFSRELGQSSAPRGSGPAAAEAARRLRKMKDLPVTFTVFKSVGCVHKSLPFSHRTTSWTVTNLASEVDIPPRLPCSQLLKT